MTKEELEKEAYQFLIQATKDKKLLYFGGNLEEILADFAEPREKRIAELEEENKVLAQNLEDTEILNNTYEKRFDNLEKENTELKENLDEKNNTVHNLDVMNKEALRYYGEVNDQLTKAKEIIKRLLNVVRNHLCIADVNFNKLINDAEKILKEQ